MIKVNEILQLSLFKDFKLLCGEEYLGNTVTGAVILEYENIVNNYAGFNNGDFVIASYFFAKSSPEIINNALSIIIKRHVSGIAIKLSDDDKIPEFLIETAISNHVPLFAFKNQYTEDLIISISESLKTKAQYIVLEEKLNSILNLTEDTHTVKNMAYEINHDFLPYVITANITPKNEEDNVSIHSYFKKLMYRQYRSTEKCPYSFVKYKYGIVLICSFNEDSLPPYGSHYNYIATLLNSVEFNPSNFYIGICDTPMPLKQLNIAVHKAIDANVVCQYLKTDYKIYSGIGIYKYIMSLVNNKMLYNDIEKHINLLKKHDAQYASNLLDTLIVYIQNNGDIPKTSTAIYQHSNTVRYRIKKACSLLSLSLEHAYEELYLIISCYLLNCTIDKKNI